MRRPKPRSDELREFAAVLHDAAIGGDTYKLRRVALSVAKRLREGQIVQWYPRPKRELVLAGITGFVAGIILYFVLVHTFFVPSITCRSFSSGGFTCQRR